MKKHDLYSERDSAKNFSPLPNEVFYLGLFYGAIAVYGYLMHIEDRKTFQSYAGYNTIGRAAHGTPNSRVRPVGAVRSGVRNGWPQRFSRQSGEPGGESPKKHNFGGSYHGRRKSEISDEN